MKDKQLTTLFKNGLFEVYGNDIPKDLTFTQFICNINNLIKRRKNK